MGLVNKSLGSKVDVEFRGKTYQLSPWSYKVQAAYERYLEREAMEAVDRVARLLPPAEGKELRASVVRDIAVGVYSFGSEEVGKSLNSNRNATKFILLSLQVNHPEVTQEFVEELLEEKSQEVWSSVNAAGSDPTKGTTEKNPTSLDTPTIPT